MPVCNQCKKFSNCRTVDSCEHCGAKDWTRQPEKIHDTYFSGTKIFVRTVSVCVFLVVVGGVISGVLALADESGWIPHTKDIPVSVDTRNWIPEEVKLCESAKAEAKTELTGLICYEGDNSQGHILRLDFGVRFRPTRINSGNVPEGKNS